jgi:hypothetical protein
MANRVSRSIFHSYYQRIRQRLTDRPDLAVSGNLHYSRRPTIRRSQVITAASDRGRGKRGGQK